MDIGNTAPCKPGGEMFEHAADAAEVRGFLAGLAGLAGHEPGDGPAKIRAAAHGRDEIEYPPLVPRGHRHGDFRQPPAAGGRQAVEDRDFRAGFGELGQGGGLRLATRPVQPVAPRPGGSLPERVAPPLRAAGGVRPRRYCDMAVAEPHGERFALGAHVMVF